jgi:hypothetical protein
MIFLPCLAPNGAFEHSSFLIKILSQSAAPAFMKIKQKQPQAILRPLTEDLIKYIIQYPVISFINPVDS